MRYALFITSTKDNNGAELNPKDFKYVQIMDDNGNPMTFESYDEAYIERFRRMQKHTYHYISIKEIK